MRRSPPAADPRHTHPRTVDPPPAGADPAAIRRWGLAVALQAAAIAATGLSRGDLERRRRAGETPAELSRSGAVDAARVRRAVQTTARAQLDAAVLDGDLTAAEARAVLGRIDHELAASLGLDVRVPA